VTIRDADDPRIDGYNARTIRELDAERARHTALVKAARDIVEQHGDWPEEALPSEIAALRAALNGEPADGPPDFGLQPFTRGFGDVRLPPPDDSLAGTEYGP